MRTIPAVAAALLVATGLVVLRPRHDPRPANPLPVILFTVDTLRADRLGFHGHDRPTSPNLDLLAGESIVFENAITPRSKTTPAVASLMTGLLPHRHGVRSLYQPLSEGPATLAGLLAEAGYETAAFVSNFVLKRDFSGLDRGFERYDEEMPTREPRRPIYERSASDTAAAVRRWLAEPRERPFFLWVHWMDPHGPYRPPVAHFEAAGGERLPREAIPDYQYLGTEDRAAYVAAYDSEIRCLDEEMGALLGELRARGLLDRSLFAFTADHGESLGEHGEVFEHGANVYEPCARVPFLVRPPGGRGARVREPASLVDLVPTVLAVLGLPARRLDGHALFDASWNLLPTPPYRLHEREDTVRAVRSADRKVVATVERGTIVRLERYDLRADPGERNPIEPGDATWRPLETVLARYVEESVDPFLNLADLVARRRRELSAEHREGLRALGYLGR